MVDIATSVLNRLKNNSKTNGRSYQLSLQLFCQEEFLRRLSKSKYSDNFILKGGLFLYSISNFESRVTVDIDFLLKHIPNTEIEIKNIVTEIIKTDTGNNFVNFEIKKIEPISLQKKYNGISVSLIAYIKNTKTPFTIDFGFGDIIIPNPDKRYIPTQLDDFTSPEINTYSIESTIAEKIDAILDLMEFSSRMKDYYDIFYLANNFSFSGTILTESINKTFDNRNHVFTYEQFKTITNYDNVESMVKKWNLFCKKINIETTDFKYILDTIHRFLNEPIYSVLNNKQFNKNWNFEEKRWGSND